MLRKVAQPDPTLDWAHDVIERQVKHMARLLEDLLDVARILQGKIVLKTEPTDLAEVMARAVEDCLPLIEARRQTITLKAQPARLWLQADPIRLEQVLTNLLNNAAKYTGEEGHITLTAVQEDACAVIRVADNGMGIAPEILPHVFDLFIQADRSLAHSQGGLGVGLTLVKKLVEMQGGSISAASAGIDRGSEFTVRLPLLSSAAAATSVVPPVPSPAASGLRILVADDYSDVAESLAVLLRMEGHEVKAVMCGEEAVACAPSFRPHVVLLDIGLPDLDGYAVAQRLRALPATCSAELIAVTGYGQDDDRQRSRAAGFDHHLLKPVDFSAIRAILAGVSDKLKAAQP